MHYNLDLDRIKSEEYFFLKQRIFSNNLCFTCHRFHFKFFFNINTKYFQIINHLTIWLAVFRFTPSSFVNDTFRSFFQSFKNCVTFVISISFVKIVRSVKSFINSSFSSSIRKIVRSVKKYCVSSLFGDFKYFFRSFWKMWFLFLSYLSNYFLKVKAKCIIYYYVHG